MVAGESKLGHKEANAFIRKYNSQIAIKNYSKMNIRDKMKVIESHIRKTHTSSPMRKEYNAAWGMIGVICNGKKDISYCKRMKYSI